MSLSTYPSQEKIIDQDDAYAQVSLGATTRVTVVSLRCKTGKMPRLVAFRNAVDSTGVATTTWELRINGAALPNYGQNTNQWGSPEQDVYLPKGLDVPQGSLIEVVAINSGGSTYNVTARVIVVYFDPPGFGSL